MGRITVIASAAAALVAAAAFTGGRYLSDNKLPNTERPVVLYVYPDTGSESVLGCILDSAEVRRPGSLRRAFRSKDVATYIKPGRYEIPEGATSVSIARMLNNCWQSPCKLVLSGTMRSNGQIAAKIAAQMMVDSAEVAQTMADSAFLASLGFTPQSVFSLFLPDTYEMYWTASAEEILIAQKKAYDAFWTSERKAKAKSSGLSQEEVSILASIVKGETNYEPEMPRIAGAYLNRLHKGMKLQADPTVAYCLDYKVNRILRKHLLIDSPYNTYRHAGLPPGPIAVPTKACLDAVLNPEGKYLYFCASPQMDGTHRFATSYFEHLKNARAFQKELNRRSSPAR